MIKAMRILLAIFLLLSSTKAFASVHVVSPEAKIDLTTDKVAYIEGDFDHKLKASFEKEMISTLSLPGDRLIIINSPGGMVDPGLEMLKIIAAEQAAHVRIICVVVGNAHSMAFNFLTHCDVRLAVASSVMLVHKIERVIPCNDSERHTARNLRVIADTLDQLDEQFRRANAKAMRLSLSDYDIFADRETVWHATTLFTRGYLHGFAVIQK